MFTCWKGTSTYMYVWLHVNKACKYAIYTPTMHLWKFQCMVMLNQDTIHTSSTHLKPLMQNITLKKGYFICYKLPYEHWRHMSPRPLNTKGHYTSIRGKPKHVRHIFCPNCVKCYSNKFILLLPCSLVTIGRTAGVLSCKRACCDYRMRATLGLIIKLSGLFNIAEFW